MEILQASPPLPLPSSFFPLPTLSLGVQRHITHLSVIRLQGALARPDREDLNPEILGFELDASIG